MGLHEQRASRPYPHDAFHIDRAPHDVLKSAMPWLRTLASIPLCVFAFNTAHSFGAALSPRAYEALLVDNAQRLTLLAFITLAGVVATFVVVAISGHRAWLHVAALLAIGLVIDLLAVFRDFADQPLWFRAMVIAVLPVQAVIGKWFGTLTWSWRVLKQVPKPAS